MKSSIFEHDLQLCAAAAADDDVAADDDDDYNYVTSKYQELKIPSSAHAVHAWNNPGLDLESRSCRILTLNDSESQQAEHTQKYYVAFVEPSLLSFAVHGKRRCGQVVHRWCVDTPASDSVIYEPHEL
eukprot:2531390-Amphidinium_carterae.1